MNKQVIQININEFKGLIGNLYLKLFPTDKLPLELFCCSEDKNLIGILINESDNQLNYTGLILCKNKSTQYNIFNMRRGFSVVSDAWYWVQKNMNWFLNYDYPKIEKNLLDDMKNNEQDDLIGKTLEIIKSYRKDDFGVKIDKRHIEKWISQFDENDREFILSELLYTLPNSYISKENALEILDRVFEALKRDFKYENVENLLEHVCFLRCQDDHKSQSVLLNFFNEILIKKYGRSVNDCGSKEVKYWLYIDDILASGGTCRKDLLNVIKNHGKEKFKDSNIVIVCIYFIVHEWGCNNSRFTLGKSLDYELNYDRLKFYRIGTIENNPRINRHNESPKFNNVYPIRSENGERFLEFIESAFERNYPMTNEDFAFRNPDYPLEEDFFSSKENRNRYESILLEKGIEIIQKIDNLHAEGLRPLGMTPPAYKTLGTGSHIFTWRNISNTCPLVFWWESNGWYPLFPVKNRGR